MQAVKVLLWIRNEVSMIRKKWLDIVAVTGIVLSLMFTIVLTYFPHVFALEPKGVHMKYETELFNKNQIITIDILMNDKDWEDMLENSLKEEYYCCDVVVNGVTYYNVGIRPKGNTSLSQVASSDTTDRYSFKLEFDHYDSTQTCMGLDKLVLNNMISDATYRKEYLSYDIMEYLGVETSLFSYADVSRNGETWGLYFALEAMEESYAERVFGVDYGELYKPETIGMSSGNGSDLAYVDNEIDSYSGIFDAAVFQPSEKDKKRVIEALENLEKGINLEQYIDVDAMLRYIASNTFLVNDDSYFGTMLHNYYLYEEDGKLSMLPWDYNLAFGGFQSHNASEVINRGIDDVVSGNLEERPIIAKLLEVEEYQEQYYEYLEELISGYFESGHFEEVMQSLDNLIDNYVKNDPTAFFTYEEYIDANSMLKQFCEKRAESIRKQLDGTLSKTVATQTSEARVDTSDLTISVMGSQGGKGMEGNRDKMAEVMGRAQKENNENPSALDGVPALDNMLSSDNIPPSGNMPPTGEMENNQAWVNPKDENEMQGEKGEFSHNMGEGRFQGGGPGGFTETFQRESANQDYTWAWLGISVLVMVAGLLFARLYPRSRY